MFRHIQINQSNAYNDERLRKLYESSFPPEEQIPYDRLIEMFSLFDIDFSTFYDGEKLVGMWVVNRTPKYNWGMYAAVPEELRGKGIGQKLLTLQLEKYLKDKKPFIGDVESPLEANAPNLEIRKRRYNYYIRNGFKDTGVSYIFRGTSWIVVSTSDEPFTLKDYDEMTGPTMEIVNKK